MCTALSCNQQHHYFGRNLDLERGYGEDVVITPRNFPLPLRCGRVMESHYAMIGMAAVAEGYPLYFDATNEHSLSMAGLNFPDNAVYQPWAEGKENVAPFELVPFLLGTCRTVQEAKQRLANVHVTACSFSEALPVSPLHWMIADREACIVLECTKDGMQVYDNPFGVLTNNPAFDFHRMNVSHYMGLHAGVVQNRLDPALPLYNHSLGLGAFGLPGDFSSASRFVRAVFVKENSVWGESGQENMNQFFHILRSVAMPKGCVKTPAGEYEYTRYTSCCDTDTLTYCYTTYQNPSIRKVALHAADLNGCALSVFPMEE